MLKEVAKRLTTADLNLELTDAAKDELLKEGRDHAFGARPLRRAIQKLVEDEVSEMIIRQSIAAGDTVVVDTEDSGKLKFTKKHN
jgi:ATP-dependent Clp protease ATP-binding subunit ClpC